MGSQLEISGSAGYKGLRKYIVMGSKCNQVGAFFELSKVRKRQTGNHGSGRRAWRTDQIAARILYNRQTLMLLLYCLAH